MLCFLFFVFPQRFYVTISLADAETASTVLTKEQADRILGFIRESINGVYTMSADIDGLVESSSNLGQVQADESGIEIRQMTRSSSVEKLNEIGERQKALAAQYGLSIEVTKGSKAWPYKADSVMIPKVQEIYKAQNGEDIKVMAIHAGLECGVFGELVPGLDIISIGPDVLNAHSPEETLKLNTLYRTWRLLEELLISLE